MKSKINLVKFFSLVLFFWLLSSFALCAFAQMPPPREEDYARPFGQGVGQEFGRRPGGPMPYGGGDGPHRFGDGPGGRRPLAGGKLPGGSNFRRVQANAASKQPDEHTLSALTSGQKVATFSGNVRVFVSGQTLDVESNGIPNHPTGNYPNEHNPNSIQEQDYHFHIPLKPQIAEIKTPLPFGPIGVAVNGIPFYNPYNAEGQDAVFGPNAEVFDSCCGHPDPRGRYHYHKYPVCINSPFRDSMGKHSPLIGWAFDGFAIYGPNGENGQSPMDLDECNGHIDDARGYHYHVTNRFPYVLGAYRGVLNLSNFDGPVWGR